MEHQEDYLGRLEARIAALEAAGDVTSPDDRRLDELLRKFARSIEMTAWLGGMCLKVAPLVAGVWFFGEQALNWLREVAWTWLGK